MKEVKEISEWKKAAILVFIISLPLSLFFGVGGVAWILINNNPPTWFILIAFVACTTTALSAKTLEVS